MCPVRDAGQVPMAGTGRTGRARALSVQRFLKVG